MTSREFRDRLAKRARKADLALPGDALELLERYYRLLERWNDKINLTGLRLHEPADSTLDRLLVEPIAAARYVPDDRFTWFDLGSGGGSPAIPLKVVRPPARLTMVEAKAKKAAFLREATHVLKLADTTVANVRFEDLRDADPPEIARHVDVVTVRAVRIDESLLDTVARLLPPGGRFLLFAGRASTHLQQSDRFSEVQTAKLTTGESSYVTVFVRQ